MNESVTWCSKEGLAKLTSQGTKWRNLEVTHSLIFSWFAGCPNSLSWHPEPFVFLSLIISAYNFLPQSHIHAGSLIHMRCAFRQTWIFTCCHLASHFPTHCSPCQTPIHLSKPLSNIILLGCLCRPLLSRLNYSLGCLCALNIISSVAAGSVYWFLNKKNYLCIIYFFGCTGSSLLYRISLVAVSRGSSLVVFCRPLITGASLVAQHGLWGTGSVVVTQELGCPTACGMFLDQGSNPCPLHWQVDS